MDTSENMYSMLNRTVEQSHQTNPATPHDKVLGTKTAPSKEKSKKDQCERNLVWIMISVNILLLLAVGAVAVVALVQVSKLNTEIVSFRISPPLAEDSKLNDDVVFLRASLSNTSTLLNNEIVSLGASFSNSSAVLSQNFSSFENKTQIQLDRLDSRVNDLYTIHLTGRNSGNP